MNATRKHSTALALALGLVLGAHSQAMGEETASTADAKPTEPAESATAKLFGQELRNANGEKVAIEKLDGKLVGIYFSAHWCPPCRAFTPKLVEFHKAVTAVGKPFEIVFVSSDKDGASMTAYMKETAMPWLAVPFGEEPGRPSCSGSTRFRIRTPATSRPMLSRPMMTFGTSSANSPSIADSVCCVRRESDSVTSRARGGRRRRTILLPAAPTN